jgi:hypothetical protein
MCVCVCVCMYVCHSLCACWLCISIFWNICMCVYVQIQQKWPFCVGFVCIYLYMNPCVFMRACTYAHVRIQFGIRTSVRKFTLTLTLALNLLLQPDTTTVFCSVDGLSYCILIIIDARYQLSTVFSTSLLLKNRWNHDNGRQFLWEWQYSTLIFIMTVFFFLDKKNSSFTFTFTFT